MEKLIHKYKQDCMLLRDALEGLTEEELRFHPAPNKWSIHQIVIHVMDDEILSTHRLRKVLAEKEPLLLSERPFSIIPINSVKCIVGVDMLDP